MKIFSFGGGVQSTAALVLAATGRLDVDAFLFANVGDDSEHPATLRYVHDVAMPYAERHAIALHELRRVRKDGTPESLYQRLLTSKRSIDIPVRMANGAPGNRKCTGDFKIGVVAKWMHYRGEINLGISRDEWHRMRSASGYAHITLAYPLIERRMSRQDCVNVIVDAGLPVPPKSSCWFCPFHRLSTWQTMRDTEPGLFDKARDLERLLNERRAMLGKDAVWLTTRGKPLARAVGDASQPSLFGDSQFEDDACESGYCVA